MRQGFNYALIIDDAYVINVQNIELIKCFEYIIINPKHKCYNELSELTNLVIDR